jgi:hypothetical protein
VIGAIFMPGLHAGSAADRTPFGGKKRARADGFEGSRRQPDRWRKPRSIRDMTSIVDDFAAIRARRPSAEPSDEPEPSLAALIAEERRAWHAISPVDSEMMRLRNAWREANPDVDEDADMPQRFAPSRPRMAINVGMFILCAASMASASVARSRCSTSRTLSP